MYVNGPDAADIRNNRVHDNHFGICALSGSRNNVTEANASAGILIQEGTGGEVSGNTTRNNNTGIWAPVCAGAPTIHHNLASENHSDGILETDCAAVVRNNTVWNETSWGISVVEATGAVEESQYTDIPEGDDSGYFVTAAAARVIVTGAVHREIFIQSCGCFVQARNVVVRAHDVRTGALAWQNEHTTAASESASSVVEAATQGKRASVTDAVNSVRRPGSPATSSTSGLGPKLARSDRARSLPRADGPGGRSRARHERHANPRRNGGGHLRPHAVAPACPTSRDTEAQVGRT